MKLAERLIHHPPKHLGEPEVGSGKNAEDGGYGHHQMEVTHHKVGGMQKDVKRGLRQEESADAAADKHGNHAHGKERSRVDAQLRAVEAA